MASDDLDEWDNIAVSVYGSDFSLLDPNYTLDDALTQPVLTPVGDASRKFYRLDVAVE